MGFAENLRDYRMKKRATQREMAKDIGISQSSLALYERAERKPSFEILCRIASYLEVSMNQLMTDEAVPSPTPVPSPSLPDSPDILPITTQKIPLLGDIACGQPTEPGDTFEAYVEAGSEVKADFALRAHGESMTGARILDGDVVFIRSQPAVDDGEIAAVMIDGETTLKRVRHAGDDLVLWPENPSYQPIIISSDSESDVRVIGKAVAFQSDVR